MSGRKHNGSGEDGSPRGNGSRLRSWLIAPVRGLWRVLWRYRCNHGRVFFFLRVLQLRLRHGRSVIVVHRRAAMGDIICTFPLCLAAKAAHGGAPLLYVTLPGNAELVRLGKIANAVFAEIRPFQIPARIPGLIAKVYAPTTFDERGQLGVGRHLVDDLAASCGLELLAPQPQLHPGEALLGDVARRFALDSVRRAGRQMVLINAGQTWPVREWPISRWTELVVRLQATYDAHFIQVGVHDDSRTDSPKIDLPNVQHLIGALTAAELVCIVKLCRLVISIDSGPVHIAGAVGTPVLGLFGAIAPEFRLPRGPVAEGVHADVPCLFCHHRDPILHWLTGCPHGIRCMDELSVEAVFRAIEQSYGCLLKRRDLETTQQAS